MKMSAKHLSNELWKGINEKERTLKYGIAMFINIPSNIFRVLITYKKGNETMILKILLIDMIIVAVLMYLVLLGANMSKTAEEREMEDKEQIKYLKKYNSRRKKNGK